MKKYKYKIYDIVRSPKGHIGRIQKVDTIMVLGSNGMKPKHYDYWVYFGTAREGGYKESELKLIKLSKEKRDNYNQTLSFGQSIIE